MQNAAYTEESLNLDFNATDLFLLKITEKLFNYAKCQKIEV